MKIGAYKNREKLLFIRPGRYLTEVWLLHRNALDLRTDANQVIARIIHRDSEIPAIDIPLAKDVALHVKHSVGTSRSGNAHHQDVAPGNAQHKLRSHGNRRQCILALLAAGAARLA